MKYPGNAINAALRSLGRTAYENARENCPVRTGRLKNSIRMTETVNRASDETHIVIGTNVRYAKYVELGGRNNAPAHFLGGAAEYAAKCAPAVFSLFLRGMRSD